ncbi:MAG: hypothetical protein KGL05_03470 [Acidobacteriota bacterium]|nr:hypothetical protein [Acidobacteriota bacterium]MDE3092279.1 hypothetical protein [Acidobacteriota bacterium]MDE3138885.1 hypothetical protein [Acidobacteriota bacterium]
MNNAPLLAADEPVRWRTIEARGTDTLAFLQGQLSCDVNSLSSHEWRRGLLLTPAGEVVTSLSCRAAREGVDLVVRAEALETTLSALRRFLLRTQCELRGAGEADGPYTSVGQQVDAGAPGPREFARGLSAHSFGQYFVDEHVSFTKGCFTGQELVGRLDSRGGNVPFRLARVRGQDLNEMARVLEGAGPSGERALQGVTTVVASPDTGEYVALAVVHRTLLGEEWAGVVDDVRVELLHDPRSHAR